MEGLWYRIETLMIPKHDFKYDGLRLLKKSKVFWSTPLTSGRTAVSYSIFLGSTFRDKILSWIDHNSDPVWKFLCL